MRVRLYKNKAELPKLFSGCEAGLLKYMDNMPFKEPIWRDFQAIGFEKILKTVYLGIKQERRRIIFVFGPDGSGKTPVAKQVGNMFIERKCFNDIKYINMDKISNMKILLSRIAKVSGFLQNRDYLKNIPQNLEGFVVLENINCLVENHSTEFMELLKELLERTKLHFLIVCTFDQMLVSNCTLNLTRTSMKEIYMPSLSVQKAARLLQMVCIDKLEEQGLTLKEIQNHSIFHVQKDEKLIPRKVFDIGFLLNKGFTLDQCEELIAENRAKSLELAGEATLARVSLMTTLRHRYVEYYDILCFLTFFRQGLLLQDLNEGAAMLSKSDFWVKAVFIFTKVTTDSEFDEYHCDYEQEVTDHRDHGKTEYEICNLIYEDRGRCFGKEQVLKMHKEDVLLRDDIIIRATYSLKQAINLSDRDSEYTSWKSLTRVCNFYQSMLHAMIQKLKIGTGENIIESSALSLNPFWHNVSFKIQLRKHYISDSKYQRKDVRELLGFHENNLRKLLTATDQFSIYGGMRYVVRHPQYLCTFLELIEELLVEILTVYSMLESKDAIAEMTHSIRELLQDLLTLAEPLSEDADTNESAEKLNDLSRLDIKIELHRLSTTCNSLRASTRPGGLRSLSNEETTEIEQQLRSTLELLEKYSRPDGPAFKMEFLISKYFLYAYNKFKSTTNTPKIMEQVINQLEILERDIPTESDTDYELIRAKTAYTLAHFYKTNRKPFTSRLSDLLTSAIKTFSDFGLDFLRLKTIKLYLDTADISLPDKIKVVEEAITLAHKLKNEKKKKHFERILKDLQAEKDSLEMSKILFLNNFQVLRPDEEPVESRRHSKQHAERSRLRSKKPKKSKDGTVIPSKRVRRKSSNAHNRYFPAHQRHRKHGEGEQGDGSASQNEDHSIGMTDEEKQSRMEIESNLGRDLDKGLVFLTRELRSVVFNDLQKLNKKLLIEFDHFSNRKFKELLSRRTGAVCRICVVDAPIYVNPNPVPSHKASTPSSKNHSQAVLQMTDLSINSSNPPGIPPTDVLIILGELKDKGLANAISAARIPYVISLQLSHKILHRLDLLNSVLVHSFKYCFLQRVLKELIEGKHVESAVQAAEYAAAADVQAKIEAQEIRFWDLSKIENTVHGVLPSVHEIDYTSYFANCVKVASSYVRSDGKSTSGVKKGRTTISFKSGSITEIKSIFSTHKFFEFRRIPLRREDLLKRLLHEVRTQTSIINLYGKDGCGKTGFVKMMLNEVKSWNFYPDGVHLFSLKHFAKKNPGGKIRDLMKHELGTEFDLNPQQYFENRKMLLVFDDFHIVTKENELEFPSSLVNILLEHPTVKVFLLSVGKIDLRDMGAVKHFEIERMTDQETLMLIFTLRKGMYFKYDAEKFEQFRCSDSVREAMKRPRKAEGSDFINREIRMNIPHHAELHLNKLQKVQHHGAFSTVGQHKHSTERGKHHHHQHHHHHSNLAHDMSKPMSERKHQLDSSVDMSLTKKISAFASSTPQEQGSSVRSGALQLSEIGSVKSPSQNSKGSHFHKVMNFDHHQPESATLNDVIKHHRDKDGIFREVRDIPDGLLARTHSMVDGADKVGHSLKYLPKPEHPTTHGGKTARSIAAHSHQTLYDDSSYEEETHSMSKQAHIPDGDCKINSSLSHYKQDPRSKFKKAHSVKSVDVHYSSDSSLEQPEPAGMKSSRGMPTKYEKKVSKVAKQHNIAQTQARLPPFKPEGGIPKIKSEFLLELDEKTISKRDPDTGRRGGVITTGPLLAPSLSDLTAPQPTPSPTKKRRDRPRKNKKKGQPTQPQAGPDADQQQPRGGDSNDDSDLPDDDADRTYRFPHK